MGLTGPRLIKRRSELIEGNAYDIYMESYNLLPHAPYIYLGYQENDNRYEFRSYTQNQLRSFDYSSVEGMLLPDGRLRTPTPLPADVEFGTRYLTIYNYKLPNQAPRAVASIPLMSPSAGGAGAGGAASMLLMSPYQASSAAAGGAGAGAGGAGADGAGAGGAVGAGSAGAGGAAYRTGFSPSLTTVRLPYGGEWFMFGGRRKTSKTTRKRKTKMRYSPKSKKIRKVH